ncbi:prolipoprotein diacylglyceryl transferase family protein, partial [uncultured Selenomonas sp.]
MHQYLFYIGDFPIRSYGVVISLSILLATGVGYFLAKADGRGYEKHVPDLGIYCGIAGLLGARLWDVFFFDWDYYQHHLTEILNVWQGGMAIQ